MIQIPAVANDLLPTNAHGNIEVWDEDLRFVPQGAVYIPGSHVVRTACKLQLYHAPAMIGFDRVRTAEGKVRPIIGGAIVLVRDALLLREAVAYVEDTKEEKAVYERVGIILQRWEDLVRNLLTKQRVKKLFGFV